MTRPSRIFLAVLSSVGLSLATSSCASTVPVELSFPTSEAFRATELVAIDVVAVGTDGCPEALRLSAAGGTFDGLVATLDATNVCDARAGVHVSDPGSGAFAFVGLAFDATNHVILAGCSIGEAYPGAPPVRIELYPTGDYANTPAAGNECAGGAM